MTFGVLIRATGVLGLLWMALLGPRVATLVEPILEGDALPRATLRVERTGCERGDITSHIWRCELEGPLAGATSSAATRGIYRYQWTGDDPDRRFSFGDEVPVAVWIRASGDLRLLDAERPGEAPRRELEHLVWQPLASLVVLVALWVGLLLISREHRAADAEAFVVPLWGGLPAFGLALLALAVALIVSPLFEEALRASPAWALPLLALAAMALRHTFWVVRYVSGTRAQGWAIGPWRLFDVPVPLGDVQRVRLDEPTRVPGIDPPWVQRRVVIVAKGRTHEFVSGRPRRMERVGRDLAAYLGVPLTDASGRVLYEPPVDESRATGRDFDRFDTDALDLDGDDGDAEAAGAESPRSWPDAHEDRQWPSVPPPTMADQLENEGLADLDRATRWRHTRRAVAILVFFGGMAGVAAVVTTGGIDPSAARLLEPDVTAWPAGDAMRRAAVEVVGRRAPHPETLESLVRLAHTLEPDEALWDAVMAAAGRVLGRTWEPSDAPRALAELDLAAAEALGKSIGPLGVLGWRELDEYFVMSLDDMAGEDAAVAVERFNSLVPPDGLPTAEWYLSWVGRSLADPRPLSFAIVAEGPEDEWRPVAALPASIGPDARRISAATVGEALAVGLWGLPGYRPASPDVDVAAWWAPIAERRRLPHVAAR